MSPFRRYSFLQSSSSLPSSQSGIWSQRLSFWMQTWIFFTKHCVPCSISSHLRLSLFELIGATWRLPSAHSPGKPSQLWTKGLLPIILGDLWPLKYLGHIFFFKL